MTRLETIEAFVRERYANHPHELDHVLRVASYAETESEEIVALVHDLVEDNFATMEELDEIGVTAEERIAVAWLTRYRGSDGHYLCSYEAYISSILGVKNTSYGQLAINVKTYDLFDHLHPHVRDEEYARLWPRYCAALENITLNRGYYKQPKGE